MSDMHNDRPSGSRGRSGGRKDEKGPGARRGMFRRRRICKFCAEHIEHISYKDVRLLSQFVPERERSSRVVCPGRAPRTNGSCRRRSSARVSSR